MVADGFDLTLRCVQATLQYAIGVSNREVHCAILSKLRNVVSKAAVQVTSPGTTES